MKEILCDGNSDGESIEEDGGPTIKIPNQTEPIRLEKGGQLFLYHATDGLDISDPKDTSGYVKIVIPLSTEISAIDVIISVVPSKERPHSKEGPVVYRRLVEGDK